MSQGKVCYANEVRKIRFCKHASKSKRKIVQLMMRFKTANYKEVTIKIIQI